jgi:hypothetical protein
MTEEAKPKKKRKRGRNKPRARPRIVSVGKATMELSERETLIFKMLAQRKVASADDILTELKQQNVKLNAKRGTHSLGVLMKYLTAKACQEGFIITMVGGGQGAGNKASYSMEKRF